MGVICKSDTSLTMSPVSLSRAAWVCILHMKLCLSSVFVPAWPQFSPNTIVQWLPRLEKRRAILEMISLDEKHNICVDRDFTFCSVQQYMSNILGSQPRDFSSFLWDRARSEYETPSLIMQRQ